MTPCSVSNDFELSNVSAKVIKKILLSLDTSQAAAKFQRDGAEVMALPLRNIINKLSTFPEECKIAKSKFVF